MDNDCEQCKMTVNPVSVFSSMQFKGESTVWDFFVVQNRNAIYKQADIFRHVRC